MTKETKLIKLLDKYDDLKTQLFFEYTDREKLIQRYRKTDVVKFGQESTALAEWGVEQDDKIKKYTIEKIFEIINE